MKSEIQRRLAHLYDTAEPVDCFGRAPATPREIEVFLDTSNPQRAEVPPQVKPASPWSFLPSGTFSIENGCVVPYQDVDQITTRKGLEDRQACDINGEDSDSTSVKRQVAQHRQHQNAGRKPRGGYRPQQGGRR